MFSRTTAKPYYELSLTDIKSEGIIQTLNTIGKNVYDKLYEELLKLPDDKPIYINVETHGGSALYCHKICRLLQSRSHPTRVIIQKYGHSAGTCLALCADELYIDKNASLSPIDPQIPSPLEKNHVPLKMLAGIFDASDISGVLKNVNDFYKKQNDYSIAESKKYINKKYTDVEKDKIIQHMYVEPTCHEELYWVEDLERFGIKFTLL